MVPQSIMNIQLKMAKAEILAGFEEYEKCFEVLKICIDEHFGLLPNISELALFCLQSYEKPGNHEICLRLIEKCDVLVQNGNHIYA